MAARVLTPQVWSFIPVQPPDNEDRDALETTLRGIAENVRSWGERARARGLPKFSPAHSSDRLGVEFGVHWSEVIVVIVSDGVVFDAKSGATTFQVPSPSALEMLQVFEAGVDDAESWLHMLIAATPQEIGLWSEQVVLDAENAAPGSVAAHVFQTTAILRPSDVSRQSFPPLQVRPHGPATPQRPH